MSIGFNDIITGHLNGTPHSVGRKTPAAVHHRQVIDPSRIPEALRALPQWANWHSDKVIRNPRTGSNGSSTNPKTWASFEDAYRADPTRLVFIFQAENNLVGLDVDGRTDSELMERFPDLYWERSLSGNGLHGIGYGSLPTESSGKHPAGIGVFQHSRYFVMTGDTVPGHETMGAFGDDLETWYRESFPEPTPTQIAPVTLTLEDQDIVERIRAEKNGAGIGGALLDGDNAGYDGYSDARFALASKCCFYTDDAEQIARILLDAGLFKATDREHDHDRKARIDAEKAVATYSGPRYSPDHRSGPRLIAVDGLRIDETVPDDAGIDYWKDRALKAEEHAQAADNQIIHLQDRIKVQLVRIQRADEREAILTNTKLGAPRQVLTALNTIFKDEQPKPKSPDPDYPEYRWRVPLAKLAEETGLSTDACSRQAHKAGTYRTEAGDPVLYVKTFDIPETVNQETGEIINPHKEMWAAPAVPREEFGRVLATLEPKAAPKHGGAPDRSICPDHPDAVIIRRSKTIRRITRECAECHTVLMSTDVEVGHDAIEHLPPTQHHAFPDGYGDSGGDPESGHPTQHDAFSEDPVSTQHDAFSEDPVSTQHDAFESEPTQQDTLSTDSHTAYQPSKMPGRAVTTNASDNICACGASIPPDRKWNCRPDCDGTAVEVAS